MGKVIMSGIVPQLTIPINPVFENNSWSDIIKACQTNTVPDAWEIGDSKVMTINGSDYQIDIIGKNHDTYSDGSGTAPLTFQMHDRYGTLYPMNDSGTNVGGWTSCAMRTTHLPAILSLMPIEVQHGIKEVNKLTSAGNKSTTISNTLDKLFLLSYVEVYGEAGYSIAGEGSQYDFYAAGNLATKDSDETAARWWTRSPYYKKATSFCIAVSMTSSTGGITDASTNSGVAFAFCF